VGRKQPYASAMKDGSPFGLGGSGRIGATRTQMSGSAPLPSLRCLRTSWSVKSTIGCQRSQPESYERWLGLEPDPHDLLIPYPSEPMTMWPISTRVNKPEHNIRRESQRHDTLGPTGPPVPGISQKTVEPPGKLGAWLAVGPARRLLLPE
jgi:hypothetical protein